MDDKVCRPGNMWNLGMGFLLLTGCKLFLSAPTPLRSLSYPAIRGAQAPTVFLLLPGRGDDAEAFAENGFIERARATPDLPVDFTAVNATLGYYVHETLHQRMRDDVLPKTSGYAHRWIGGISMGGMGSLFIAQDVARDSRGPATTPFDGILLIAPYLGDESLIAEIERAGGLAKWSPPTGPADYQRELWRYLKQLTSNPVGGPELYLAYGEQDRLVRGHRLLAAALPADHVLKTEGGHDWGAWKKLWKQFLTQWKPAR